MATILAIITITAFIVFVLSMDYFKYFLNTNPLKKSKIRIKIRRFKYFVENNLNDNIDRRQLNTIGIANKENVSITEAENAFDIKIEI